jgi:hypothetical protein
MDWRIGLRFPGGQDFCLHLDVHTASGPQQASYPVVVVVGGGDGQVLKLTAYLSLCLRICGALPSLPHTYAWRAAYVSTKVSFTFRTCFVISSVL